MKEQELIDTINADLELALPAHLSLADMRSQLQAAVSNLLKTNFQKLVSILYRIDINERKLKYLLHENVGEDAAAIIAGLIIDRQIEKIASRKRYGRAADNLNDDEKW